jgi:hypothetical protein
MQQESLQIAQVPRPGQAERAGWLVDCASSRLRIMGSTAEHADALAQSGFRGWRAAGFMPSSASTSITSITSPSDSSGDGLRCLF